MPDSAGEENVRPRLTAYMSSEPEHPMDTWLKAYARHRREQGEQLEMHPATRRLLQAEVARHYGQAGRTTRHGWSRFGPVWFRVGFALGLMVVLGAVLVNLLPPQSPPQEMAKSMDAPRPASRPREESPFRGGEGSAPLQPDADTLAPKAEATSMQLPVSASPAPDLDTPAAGPVAAKAPAVGGVSSEPAGLASLKLSKAVSYRFRRTDGTRGVGGESSTRPAPDLLARFELEQTETGLRIRDADGSVYQGTWLPAGKAVSRLLERGSRAGLEGEAEIKVLRFDATPSPAPIFEQRAFGLADAPSALSFSVAGTNRSAKQNLTLTGVLHYGSDAPLSSPPAAVSQAKRPGTWFLQGTFRLNGTNAWELQATQDTR